MQSRTAAHNHDAIHAGYAEAKHMIRSPSYIASPIDAIHAGYAEAKTQIEENMYAADDAVHAGYAEAKHCFGVLGIQMRLDAIHAGYAEAKLYAFRPTHSA